MTLDELKPLFAQLLSAAVETAARNGRELQDVRGIALYDSHKDSLFTSLLPYQTVEEALRGLEQFNERYGAAESHRVALQIVYEYFALAKSVQLDAAIVEALWSDFVAELDSPVWLTRCVTNLRHFHCEDLHVDLVDGVAIYGRDQDILAKLGFREGIWARLLEDWGGFGASSFVLVSETSMLKRPANFIMEDSGAFIACVRAIGAMRLVAPGDVGISRTFVQRVARFNIGIGGVQSIGSTVNTAGLPYTLSPERHQRFKDTYAALAQLEKAGYGKAPGNLDLALRAFMSSYDRFPTALDTKLVDAITALEAVLGTESEIAFKLSFRVASLLADTDEQRSALLRSVKNFYDGRSRIVHGGKLKAKHNALLNAVDELRDIVRRLLQSFVLFAADNTRQVKAGFFVDELDAALVHATRREELRQVLGLARSPEQP